MIFSCRKVPEQGTNPGNCIRFLLSALLVVLLLSGCGTPELPQDLRDIIESSITDDMHLTREIFMAEQNPDRFEKKSYIQLVDSLIVSRENSIHNLKMSHPEMQWEIKDELVNFHVLENEAFTIKKEYYKIVSAFLKKKNEYERGKKYLEQGAKVHWKTIVEANFAEMKKLRGEYKIITDSYLEVISRLQRQELVLTSILLRYKIESEMNYSQYQYADEDFIRYWDGKMRNALGIIE